MDLASYGLPVLTPLLLGVVAFTVFVIEKIKWVLFAHVKGKWTQKIPSWVWFALSIAIPVGIVVAVNADWVQALINHYAGVHMKIQLGGYGSVPTGVITAIASNGSYIGLKKLGATTDYTPGAPGDASGPITPAAVPNVAPVVPPQPVVPVPAVVPPVQQPVADNTEDVPTVKALLFTDWVPTNPPTAMLLTNKEGRKKVFLLDWGAVDGQD